MDVLKTMVIDADINDAAPILLEADLSFNNMTFDAGTETIFTSGSRRGGTDNYNELKNKPSINGHILIGDYIIKAVSTEPNQGLTETEKLNARKNIDVSTVFANPELPEEAKTLKSLQINDELYTISNELESISNDDILFLFNKYSGKGGES